MIAAGRVACGALAAAALAAGLIMPARPAQEPPPTIQATPVEGPVGTKVLPGRPDMGSSGSERVRSGSSTARSPRSCGRR
jgi:hypothetical protein